jgi:hypothetical protein
VIAGNAPQSRVERLRELWIAGSPWLDVGASQRNVPGPWRHLQNWTSVLHARLLGASGHSVPRYVAPVRRNRVVTISRRSRYAFGVWSTSTG